jgi:hypothetical protein
MVKGFSNTTCLPFKRACSAKGKCVSLGVVITTNSISCDNNSSKLLTIFTEGNSSRESFLCLSKTLVTSYWSDTFKKGACITLAAAPYPAKPVFINGITAL